MSKKKVLGGCLALALFVLAGCATGRNYQSDIDALNTRIGALEAQLAEKDSEIARLESRLQEKDAALTQAQNEIRKEVQTSGTSDLK